MTPAEKAKELVDKFYIKRSEDDLPLTIYWTSAKGCALIAVDEMINMCKLYHNHNIIVDGKIYTELTIEYWEQVKQEIESL